MNLHDGQIFRRGIQIRRAVRLVAAAAVLAAPGCTTAPPPDENAPIFTMEEMVAATQKAAKNAWAAGKRAAEADFAKERALVDKKIGQAVQRGRVEGNAIAAERIAAEKAAAEEAAAAKAAATASVVTKLFAKTPLLGERKLRSDKGRALESGQLVDMIYAQLDTIGYKLIISVPYKATKAVRNYDRQKVLLLMSSQFNESFVEHVQDMSVMDALNLLNKLYGFSAWFAHDEKIVWLGFPADPPTPLPNSKVDLYFNEKEFMSRVK